MDPRHILVLVGVVAFGVAGCAPGDPDDGEESGPSVPGALQVLGTDELVFDPEVLNAEAGEITVDLTAEAGVTHDFIIEETDETVVAAAAGNTASGSVELDAGTYTFYCGVPGHRNAGMEGTLEVSE